MILKHEPKAGPQLQGNCFKEIKFLCSEEYFESYIKRESDADQTGMILAQNACYDMYQNIDFLKNVIMYLEQLEGTGHEIAVKQLNAKVVKNEEFLNTFEVDQLGPCIRTSNTISTNEPSFEVLTIIFMLKILLL